MEIEREQLLRHFKRINCNGSIPNVAFSGPFRATAISTAGGLLVVTAGFPETEPLPREIGVSLDKIVEGFGCTKGQSVEVEIEADNLIFKFSNGRFCVRTFTADLVHTRMEEDFVQKALAMVPDDAWQSLDRSLVADVLQAIRAICPSRRETVAIRTTADKTTFIVGDDGFQTLEFDTSDVKSDQPYALWFDANLLRAVLEELARADGEIAFTGPNAVLGVRIGEVQYVVSPIEATRGPRGKIPHAEPKFNRVGT